MVVFKTFSRIPCIFWATFLIMIALLGWGITSNYRLADQTDQSALADAALAIKASTGWRKFDVQISDVDEGTVVIISKLPARDDTYVTLLVDVAGNVIEL